MAWYERVFGEGVAVSVRVGRGQGGCQCRKHGVTFELASTVFHDPRLLTIADLEHSDAEERWFSVGSASNDLWSQADPAATNIRLISARKSTQAESRQYQEGL